MKTSVYCQHVLKLSKAIARPHRAKHGNITLVVCSKCSKFVRGPVADLVFSTVRQAEREAKDRKLVKKHLVLRLTIAEDGIAVARMEQKDPARRVKRWKKPEATQKTIEEGPSWRVTKCASR